MSIKINFDYMGCYELDEKGYPIAWKNKEYENKHYQEVVWDEWYEAVFLPENQWHTVNYSDYQKLKDNLDIFTILEQNSVDYKVVKDRVRFLCPVHEDNNPSCDYWISLGSFKCWSCGATGDIVELNWRLIDGSK